MVLDIETLLTPIAGEQPTGPNLRDVEGGGYYRIKDARSTARIAERQADSEAERGSVAPEWRFILEHAQEVLASQSKDLEIACWMTEAALRLHGFAGLRDALAVLAGLTDRYWETLHSIDAEDLGAKVAPLTGLNGSGADGALIQPLRLAPLTVSYGVEPGTLWHYMVMRRRGPTSPEATVLTDAAKATDKATFKTIYGDVAACLSSHTTLTSRLDVLCGEESPPSSTIRNTLIEAMDALRDFAGLDPSDLTETAAPALVEAAGLADVAAAETRPVAVMAGSGPTPLHTRDDALRELGRIATFFREHEPNSPTAYTLQTLIRRARLPLADLLAELIPDEQVRRSTLNLAGIAPEAPNK